MREIKFRAKTVTTDSWVYGHYAFVDGFHVMYEGTSNPVIIKLNTLGQYTGLKDVNGYEIYEGDILYALDDNGEHEEYVGVVEYDKVGSFVTTGFPHVTSEDSFVKGNIHLSK